MIYFTEAAAVLTYACIHSIHDNRIGIDYLDKLRREWLSANCAGAGDNTELLFAEAEAVLPGLSSRINSLLQTQTSSRRQMKMTDWSRELFEIYNS